MFKTDKSVLGDEKNQLEKSLINNVHRKLVRNTRRRK